MRQRMSGLLMDSKKRSRTALPKSEHRVSNEQALIGGIMHFLDCFPDKNKNFYPQLVVLNSQKTSCITSRLNSTPEFRTRGTPQLFAHAHYAKQLPTARDPQHERFTQNAAQFRSVHKAYASTKPTIMHRGQGTRERCIRTGHNHAPLAPRPTRSCACSCPPAAHDEGRRFCEHGARARGHTSEALWHNKA